MDVDPIETEVDLKVNCQGHFNCQGNFVHFIDFDCNITVFACKNNLEIPMSVSFLFNNNS